MRPIATGIEPRTEVCLRQREEDARVVVTGLGLVTALGVGRRTNWERVLAGHSAAAPLDSIPPVDGRPAIACAVHGFDPADFISRRAAGRMDRFAQFAVAAARLAIEDAVLEIQDEGRRIGSIIGTAMGGLASYQAQAQIVMRRGAGRASPFALPLLLPNMAAAQVAMEFGLRGPLSCTCTACAAGAQAIGEATEMIRRGNADVMIAGGADAPITPIGVAGFTAAGVLAGADRDPADAARPFDADREGFVLGEAGAILVLERMDHARARDATIYCEVLGFGSGAGPETLIETDEDGRAAAESIGRALADAGVAAAEIDYVSAHGTAVPSGDDSEMISLRRALGPALDGMALSATKPAHGHCLGASSSLEAALTALAIHEGVIPPNRNLVRVATGCNGVDHVRGGPRRRAIEVALSNCMGVGGHNAALVLGAGGAPRASRDPESGD